jgi:hypothetical protein
MIHAESRPTLDLTIAGERRVRAPRARREGQNWRERVRKQMQAWDEAAEMLSRHAAPSTIDAEWRRGDV